MLLLRQEEVEVMMRRKKMDDKIECPICGEEMKQVDNNEIMCEGCKLCIGGRYGNIC